MNPKKISDGFIKALRKMGPFLFLLLGAGFFSGGAVLAHNLFGVAWIVLAAVFFVPYGMAGGVSTSEASLNTRGNIRYPVFFEKSKYFLFTKVEKFFYRHTGVFKNSFKCPTVDLFMIGNNQGNLFGRMEKFDMASFLANFSVTGAQKNSDGLIAGEKRRLHTAKLKTLWLGVEWISLGLGSKYRRIASFMLRIASFSLRPWLWHPGREGALTVIYPSSPFSKTILSFISITSQIKYTLFDSESQVDSIVPYGMAGGVSLLYTSPNAPA